MDKDIKEFIELYGVLENESRDAEMMINLGYFWSDTYGVYIAKNNMLYDDKDEEIVQRLIKEG